MSDRSRAALCLIALACAAPADAQTAVKPAPAMSVAITPTPRPLPDSASPFGPVDAGKVDFKALSMPALAYKPDSTQAADFDKYYYFHRRDTDFATAYADLLECDGYALGVHVRVADVPANYLYGGAAQAIGGAIGVALVAAVFGSAEKRRARRVNMRTCMHYKGYDRHGLPKSVWETFNFEEGIGKVEPTRRLTYLQQQALVAAKAEPQGEPLGI